VTTQQLRSIFPCDFEPIAQLLLSYYAARSQRFRSDFGLIVIALNLSFVPTPSQFRPGGSGSGGRRKCGLIAELHVLRAIAPGDELVQSYIDESKANADRSRCVAVCFCGAFVVLLWCFCAFVVLLWCFCGAMVLLL
jgi:hypothetical protein